MSDIDNDPVLQRAIDELRRLPGADPAAIRRVVGVAAEARVSPADEPLLVAYPRSTRSIRLWTAVGLAAAAGLIGFIARGTDVSRSTVSPERAGVGLPAASLRTLRPATTSGAEGAPVVEQFVLELSTAHRVSVVGDFNQWNPASAPMTRSADDGRWSAVIPIAPGRHVYGFMVDDSVFLLDPRAPKVRDPDVGTDGSVLLVGRP